MRYHVTYSAKPHPDGLDKSEALASGDGACTALLVGSLLYPDDGSYSAMFLTLDGRTGEPLHDNELWKAWTMLAVRLSRSKTLGEGKRALCEHVFGLVRDTILETREVPS